MPPRHPPTKLLALCLARLSHLSRDWVLHAARNVYLDSLEKKGNDRMREGDEYTDARRVTSQAVGEVQDWIFR